MEVGMAKWTLTALLILTGLLLAQTLCPAIPSMMTLNVARDYPASLGDTLYISPWYCDAAGNKVEMNPILGIVVRDTTIDSMRQLELWLR
jgi:hypothetical protein